MGLFSSSGRKFSENLQKFNRGSKPQTPHKKPKISVNDSNNNTHLENLLNQYVESGKITNS